MRGLAIALIIIGCVAIGGIVSSVTPVLPWHKVLAIAYTLGIILCVPVAFGGARD